MITVEVAIVCVLLAMLCTVSVAIARLRNLFAAVMLSGIFSFIGACWMLFLDAPDVAFTEASVGAGVSTILMLGALAVTTIEEKPSTHKPWLPLVIVLVTGAALVYGTLDMPHYLDPNAPAQIHISPEYLESMHTVHIPNVVTTVLASYRGYDTMGETTVIFTAGIGVVAILAGATRRRQRKEDAK